MFQTPIWTGVADSRKSKRYKAGEQIIRDSHWWLPVMAIYTGGRLEELAQLQHSDLAFTTDKIPHIKFHDEGDRRLKTSASIRNIPIHPDLQKFGFLELFDQKKMDGLT